MENVVENIEESNYDESLDEYLLDEEFKGDQECELCGGKCEELLHTDWGNICESCYHDLKAKNESVTVHYNFEEEFEDTTWNLD